MMAFRNDIRAGVPVAALEEKDNDILGGLASAGSRATTSGSSAQGQFASSSFIIIVREGLEAILVLAGMAAFLVRTGPRDGLRYLHGGWIGALALGGLTWWVASRLIAVRGAQREVTEGVTALLAAGMLLYVGFWLHSKSAGQRWSSFIRTQVSGALGRKTLWGLAAISFLAVYREVFETALFYQALLAQGSAGPVLAGFGAGCAVLLALALVIVRSTAKLPLGAVFGLSSLLLAVFAVVFAGRGVAALQAAGRFPTDPLSIPAVPWLGVYPTLQSVSLQLVLIVFIVAVAFYNSRTQPRQPNPVRPDSWFFPPRGGAGIIPDLPRESALSLK
ncbi:MAG: FTR1 family protein [Betaproteobacteria bacterium]